MRTRELIQWLKLAGYNSATKNSNDYRKGNKQVSIQKFPNSPAGVIIKSNGKVNIVSNIKDLDVQSTIDDKVCASIHIIL